MMANSMTAQELKLGQVVFLLRCGGARVAWHIVRLTPWLTYSTHISAICMYTVVSVAVGICGAVIMGRRCTVYRTFVRGCSVQVWREGDESRDEMAIAPPVLAQRVL